MRWASAKEDDKPKMMNMVIEGLRGEAALVAMDLGKDALIGAGGMDSLINAMQAKVFPKAQAEAKAVADGMFRLSKLASRHLSSQTLGALGAPPSKWRR